MGAATSCGACCSAHHIPFINFSFVEQKWNKGKNREKALNLVLFDKPSYERLLTDVTKMKLITPSTIVERLKVTGSLARAAIRELETKGLIREVLNHKKQRIYTRATNA